MSTSANRHAAENEPGDEVQVSPALQKLAEDWRENAKLPLKHRLRRLVLFVFVVILLYVLSAGPVVAIVTMNGSETGLTVCRTIYYPITLLIVHTPLAKPIRAYLSLWGV